MTTITITAYERSHREAILNLLFYSRRTHTHLDWYKPATWLDVPGVQARLAWMRGELIGFMAASQSMSSTSWIRLLGVQNNLQSAPILAALWQEMRAVLLADTVKCAYVLVVNRWLGEHLADLGFTFVEDVVTLFRNTSQLPVLPPHPLTVREAYLEDTNALLAIDHAAFLPPWQMTLDEMRQSLRQAASSSVAFYKQQPVGYQISTRHHANAHLARLGVLPSFQGQGFGAVVLEDLLTRFLRRGVRTMTVNTQHSNVHSQHLYERFEFQRNGFDLPVWAANLDDG
jgi:[ribosomal protein S18]-alanine N-acetyltransferase